MSRMLNRMKDLGAKARALKAAFDRAPAAVEDIRRTLSETTDQMQQLKTEVRASVEDLKDLKDLRDVSGTDERSLDLAPLLRELPSALEALQRAGVSVAGVDLETGPAPRLLLRFRKTSLPTAAAFRALLPGAATGALLPALHAALEGAEPLLRGIHLAGLEDREILVALGADPTVRLSWRPPEPLGAATPAILPPAGDPIPLAVPPERPAARWGADSLARFKKLPPIGKPRG